MAGDVKPFQFSSHISGEFHTPGIFSSLDIPISISSNFPTCLAQYLMKSALTAS